MGRVKEIKVYVIKASVANDFVKKHHYSGKVVKSSDLHFGAFLDDKLHGVMQFGSPTDKRKVINLVETSNKTEHSKWNEFRELNRMAFDDVLEKNSESRCLAIAFKMIRKNAPHIKWILSYSDASQCGDGAIYRSVGFHLTQIQTNKTMVKMPDGKIFHRFIFDDTHPDKLIKLQYGKPSGKSRTKWFKSIGAEILQGFQLRYIYLLSGDAKLNCNSLPYSEIYKRGAGMYRGEKKQHAAEVHQLNASQSSEEVGGANPTRPLKLQRNNSDGQSKKRETA